MYAGVLGIVFGLSEYHGRYISGYDFVETSRFGWALAYVGLLCLGAYGLGLPEIPRSVRSRLPTSFVAAIAGAAAISFVQLFVGDALLPRFVVFGSASLLVPWYYAMSSLAGAGRSALEQRDRVIVVGPADLGRELAAELAANPERPASIVGVLEEAEASGPSGERPLVEAVASSRASVLVLSAGAQTDERIVDQAARLHESGVRVRTQSLFYEEYLGKIPVADLVRVSLFFDIGEVHRLRFGRFKRMVDVSAGLVGIVALVCCIPLVLIGNLLGNRGPLFYRQERVGRAGRVFTILKFRTMRACGAAESTDWTAADDPRVTRFGRLLRVSHVDELPQVWNILKGDLSLVGPRPEQPRYVAELVQKLPFYDLRHIVRPGLTGWAQVKYGYAGDERDALEKLQYDFHYLRRQSLLFDLRVIGRTTRSLVGIEGRGR